MLPRLKTPLNSIHLFFPPTEHFSGNMDSLLASRYPQATVNLVIKILLVCTCLKAIYVADLRSVCCRLSLSSHLHHGNCLVFCFLLLHELPLFKDAPSLHYEGLPECLGLSVVAISTKYALGLTVLLSQASSEMSIRFIVPESNTDEALMYGARVVVP